MSSTDSAGVRFPPPLIFLGCLIAGYTAHRFHPVDFATGVLATITGVLAIGLSLALFGWAFPQFRLHETDVRPDRSTSAIIRTGPYQYTRNPLYLGLSLLSLGIALLFASAWMIASVAVAIAMVRVYVIRREESYLEAKFPEEYVDYKQTVRRWI